MPSVERRWFKSELDWWIGSILVAVPTLTLILVVSAVARGDREAILAALGGCVAVAAIYVLLVVPVRYGVGDDDLVVRFGVVRQHIRYESILEVRPTRSPLSSAALSLDRLAIRTGSGPLKLTLISPRDRDEFLSLVAAESRLTRRGDRLTRARDAGSV